jgi:phytoene synthase
VARGLQIGHRQFGLRYEDALAVLIGCEQDLVKSRYATWAEVDDYCYHVASSVGLLCVELFGCVDPRSRDYAIHLGRALQLTNILRDIREDAARDRIYLPTEVLTECGLTEADILSGVLPANKRAAASRLLSLVAQRAHTEYRLARAARSPRDRRALIPAEIMGQVYFSLLEELERRGLEVLLPVDGKRIALSKRQKLTAAAMAVFGSLR